MKILLVDDERIALRALKKRVDWMKYGFTEVFEACDILTAREILASERIELVLCDIELQGENGLELIRHMQEEYPETRSVMITCHADFAYVREAMRSGARDYILKPIDYEELDVLLSKIEQEIKEEKNQKRILELVQQTRRAAEEKNKSEGLQSDSDEQRMQILKDYIEDHIRDKITIKELADLIHINERHLMRIFKTQTGQTVLDYITEQRIVMASSLLKDTDYPVGFIAGCIGCENYSYFTKLFKSKTGFTPSDYRNQFK